MKMMLKEEEEIQASLDGLPLPLHLKLGGWLGLTRYHPSSIIIDSQATVDVAGRLTIVAASLGKYKGIAQVYGPSFPGARTKQINDNID